MSTQNKITTWEENEAPLRRWIGAAVFSVVVGAMLGLILNMIIRFIPFWDDGMFLEPWSDFFEMIAAFSGLFLSSVWGIRLFCNTSLRAFLFGRGRRPDVSGALIAGALMFAGMIAASIPSFGNFSVSNKDFKIIAVNLVLCLMFVWIQTTTEEILFRGFFLRPPYRNDMPALPRGLLFAVISSLVFMAAHLSNPEVTSLSFGADIIFAAASYFVGAFCLYICNLLIGGMEAGLVFHFINNFYCFFLVRNKITTLETPTIFVDNSEAAIGITSFVTELVMYLPPLIYLAWRRRSRKE
ncbi:MAG: CPBP family intramembrane metalloprotease [Lachnospiraceae bacterium]|nr:CPBP family intramembrane metalloprotease [Lachnospiraceae bacterium]